MQLIDVNEAAREAGFCCRVAVTAEVWNRCIEWTPKDTKRQGYQEQDARLWDVLFVPAMKLRSAVGSGGEMLKPDGLRYEIYCLLRGKGRDASLINLKVAPVMFEGNDAGLVISFADAERRMDTEEKHRDMKADIKKALDKVDSAIRDALKRAKQGEK